MGDNAPGTAIDGPVGCAAVVKVALRQRLYWFHYPLRYRLTAQEVGFAGNGIAGNLSLQGEIADGEGPGGRIDLKLKLDAGGGGRGRATGPRFPSGGTRILSTVNFQWLIR